MEKFGKFLWKKFGKKLWKPERTLKEHVSSATICPTLSELCFRADVRRYDHVAVYDEDNIEKAIWPVSRDRVGSADPIVCWACLLQPSAGPVPPAPAVANTAREWQAPVAENQPLTMLWQRRWTGNPVGIAIPVTCIIIAQVRAVESF